MKPQHNERALIEPPMEDDSLRFAIIAQIEARLAGEIDDAALAKWAFDSFYNDELPIDEDDEDEEDMLTATLDTLMFADDPQFRADEAELRALMERLKQL